MPDSGIRRAAPMMDPMLAFCAWVQARRARVAAERGDPAAAAAYRAQARLVLADLDERDGRVTCPFCEQRIRTDVRRGLAACGCGRPS